MAALQSRTTWLNLVLSLVIVAMNIWLLNGSPRDQVAWFAIFVFGLLFVASLAALFLGQRRRRG
jgi:hypothetical protein